MPIQSTITSTLALSALPLLVLICIWLSLVPQHDLGRLNVLCVGFPTQEVTRTLPRHIHELGDAHVGGAPGVGSGIKHIDAARMWCALVKLKIPCVTFR